MRALTDRTEEILERLWIITQEEDRRADVEMIREEDELRLLQDQGLVTTADGRAVLTEEGLEAGRMCVRRHRLAERLLADILDTGEEELHSASCKFEHGLHHGLEEKVCTMLGHPAACPHGKAIPRGKCCRRTETQTGQLLCSVADLEKNEPAVIAYLHSEEASDLRKLMAIGALPGTELTLHQRFPSYVIELGRSRFAIDRELAGKIYVRRTGG
jgi:DtxR family Mn-dependent transcriptional regulator